MRIHNTDENDNYDSNQIIELENWWLLKVYPSEDQFSNIIILPWIPNYWINNELLDFFRSKGSNVFFIDNWIKSEELEKSLKIILKWIEKSDYEWIKEWKEIFIVWFSFGWGIALKFTKYPLVKKVISLSPLLKSTENNIDWEWLYDLIKPTEKTVSEFKDHILDLVSLWTTSINLRKTSIITIGNDPEISIPDDLKPNIVSESSVQGIHHFWLRKTWKLPEYSKKRIFSQIVNYNESMKIDQFVIDEIIDIFWVDNISWIMTHWSNAFNQELSKKWDADYILVIKSQDENSFKNINYIVEKMNFLFPGIRLDISIFFEDTVEKIWIENTVTSTHSPVYNIFFWEAKVLYWDNIFSKANEIFNSIDIKKASSHEIWKYIDRLNRLFVTWNLSSIVIAKTLKRIIMCYELAQGSLEPRESNTYSIENAIEYIEQSDINNESYANLFKKALLSNELSPNDMQEVLEMLNKFYMIFELLSLWTTI